MNIQPTPAVALGSYEVTPLEIAGAYTVFANHGEVLKPYQVQMIRGMDAKPLFETEPSATPVLDPRVSYLMVDMMEEVLRSGTGARVRGQGLPRPRPVKQVPPMTAGSQVSPPSCCASSGSAMTTTVM